MNILRLAKFGLLATVATLVLIPPASGRDATRTRSQASQPWSNSALSPDQRAALAVAKITRDEKLALVFGYFATDQKEKNYVAPKGSREGSAGFVFGVPRLGIPAQYQTDAGIGVASQGGAKQKRERTALPSGLGTTATWNPDIGFAGGRMIGAEARSSGFNVMLAGGVNLLRDPRNGRNFEYGGEDPLLAGTMVGAQIAGIQSNQIISTVKHYAMNDLETGRDYHDIKPMVCWMFPVCWDQKVLRPNSDVKDDLICAGKGMSLYEAARDELRVVFGDDLVRQLDLLSAQALTAAAG